MMKTCCALLWLIVLVSDITSYAATTRPNLVPQPQVVERIHQAMELGGGAQLICPERARPAMQAAVEQLQKRLATLGASALHVMADIPSAPPGNAPAALRIVIGTAKGCPLVASLAKQLGAQLDAAILGPQGYVIRFGSVDGQPTALLAGSDEVGALYACVTLAQMLRLDGGRVLIDAADVRDWPDFQQRIIGRPSAPSERLRAAQSVEAAGREYQKYVAAMRQSVDFCVAFKINCMTLRSGGTGKWSNVEAYGPAVRAALREVGDYARGRGVTLEATAYSAINGGQGGPAAQVSCVPTHGVTYCWSRDEMLRERGRAFGRFARDAGIGLYYLHAPDNNAPGNPGLFKNRCEQCQKRWKDGQRAQADAHVMNVIAGEIRKLSPQTRICAVLVPYGATLDRLDEPEQKSVLSYWREASALLPPEMSICVRENRRPNVAAFKEAFARHPIYFYIESITWRGWEPFFTTTPRHLLTFDFDDPRDVYYMGNAPDFKALSEAMAAHYAWNTRAPGAGLHRGYSHNPLEDGTQPAEVAGDLVDRIAARMFGDEHGSLIGEAVRGDISWAFTENPEGTARATAERLSGRDSDISGVDTLDLVGLRDLPGLMRHQHEGAAAGRLALRQVFERMRSGDWKPDPWQRDQLNFMLSYFASVEALASVRYPLLAATAANQRGDRAGAKALAETGLKAAQAAPAMLTETAGWIGGEAAWHPLARRVAERVDEDRSKLEQQLKLAEGKVPELAETPDNLEKALFILRDRNVKTRSAGNGDLEFTDQYARTAGQKALHFTRPEKAWAGCSVQFDPIDIRPFAAQGGYLRFYVNSDGAKGWQRATFWGMFQDAAGKEAPQQVVYLHPPSNEERERHAWPGFVDVDDLLESWQLVSIPLAQFAAKDAAFLTGFHLNFAKVPDCGLILADPYLIGPVQPVLLDRETPRKGQ